MSIADSRDSPDKRNLPLTFIPDCCHTSVKVNVCDKDAIDNVGNIDYERWLQIHEGLQRKTCTTDDMGPTKQALSTE